MKKYIAEFIGTFALVFLGTGAIIVNEQTNGQLGLVGISLTFGLIITAMIYIFGHISGAHFNPAVTIGLAFGKLIDFRNMIFYIFCQILGAIIASVLLKFIFPQNNSLGFTQPSGFLLQSFLLEFILTFILMLVILGITQREEKEITALSGVIIGFAVIVAILFAGPISGGSFNPARSIGPALISGNLNALWIYIFAPISGSVFSVFAMQALKNKN